ncbi:hypothetical protein CISIN_1g036882mg [Citrus sinensis]|uniref:Uncharacterized protein n=1 Tax=Citrus sinensis TaxID=2711 RepID=A0A067ECV2_CITSI|nr:hypothetical protein CISIN_1g036882mg [Citrus sinensis]
MTLLQHNKDGGLAVVSSGEFSSCVPYCLDLPIAEGSYFLEDGEIIEKIDDFWSSFEGSADSCESDDSHE